MTSPSIPLQRHPHIALLRIAINMNKAEPHLECLSMPRSFGKVLTIPNIKKPRLKYGMIILQIVGFYFIYREFLGSFWFNLFCFFSLLFYSICSWTRSSIANFNFKLPPHISRTEIGEVSEKRRRMAERNGTKTNGWMLAEMNGLTRWIEFYKKF